jgi:phosphinothricin acetyltransferase
MTLAVRDATADDIPAALHIYAHHAAHGFGTFDEAPPTMLAFEAKWTETVRDRLPWLVAADGGDVLGFAYGSKFRPRSAYRYTVEDSVYIRDDARGRGIGSMLLGALLPRLEQQGARQVVAVIGDSANAASIALHRKAGFAHAGTMLSVGYKLGRWVDIVFMQKPLNGGDATAPSIPGAWRLR